MISPPTIFRFRVNTQRKYGLIVLAILIFLAVVYRFLPFFQETLWPGEEIELKERRLIKYWKMVEAGKGLDKRLGSLTKSLKELESRLLTGKTPSLAAVEIQKIVHETAGKSNVQIRSVKVLSPVELDQKDYLSILVEFHIIPTIRQLKEIVYRLETSPKFLTVRKMRIRGYSNVGRQKRCYITVGGLMKRNDN